MRRSRSKLPWPIIPGIAACLLGSTLGALAAPKPAATLAATPPLGWNSWDSYGLTINADEWKRNVDWFHDHLQPAGWTYVVVDEGWYLQHPENAGGKLDQGYTMDANGRYIPADSRFPDGLSALASYAHSLGLQFGIHIIRGIPKDAVTRNLPIADSTTHAADAADTTDTCRWNPDNYGIKESAAGQAYYDSLLALYAGWGIDFLKVDCIAKPYDAHEIHMISAAIAKTGRPIVLSLSPGPTPLANAADAQKYAQMWRISDDVWDIWSDPAIPEGGFPQTVRRQFTNLANWMQYQQPGRWPDADMLPIGYLGPRPGWGLPRNSRLSYDETRTLLTLWSIARSPMILGANLLQLDSFTENLLTNRDMIEADQHSSNNKELLVDGNLVVWSADAPKSAEAKKGRYYAVFNLGNTPATFQYTWKQLSYGGGEHRVRDLWMSQDVGRATQIQGSLPAHGSAFFRIE
ncbi:glycoside hydrolase family 27 protein [Acidipila sp. EB88]|uniref:glycoside hydrolase family 27 protein n=1 Tax=Acidipila sp. EB88 TaxID=2305226 RepID=UPI000F601D56|nr:glycoside hydrolase family 27 protein [Acidipila sp. EB88]RRA48760.1 glycoside hydrolase family 27 protein [Acidipila sp. EB88]